MANVWFLSDIHAGHRNICNFRDFESEEIHFQTIKENYHKVVSKRDKVFMLGDIAFTLDRLIDISNWPGNITLILGNHCTEHVSISEIIKYIPDCHSMVRYKKFWLTHCPVHPDELRGRLNIHGHTHSHNVDDPRYLNVSMENINYAPIDLNSIKEIFESKKSEINLLNLK